ncbi:OmpA family protein [Primorskyibacter flagellatus]|uniref:OmpA-OmpF porin, OOP family n=1 Tax=Primorskyibacter flagellatus TaxID=1387277 RepID=A0A1W1ZTX0_9RHOB|nr:OmpA family protein [Primorskyibacter flagellatus]SMC51899.1 OmpA-OmpF porin, OOP family [Primorskyibacter flagellatus]
MRLSKLFISLLAFGLAALLCLVAAYFSVRVIENNSIKEVRQELDKAALTWADVDSDGLQIFLIGTAPTEAARFDALSAAGRVVDASRVLDQMGVADTADLAPPRFSVEILRNDAGISLIGLVPASTDREALLSQVRDIADDPGQVSDLLEVASFDAPDGWADALRFSLWALEDLPRSKISVGADQVQITAMTDSDATRRKMESDLVRRAGDKVTLSLDLSAPRPVISPFTLRFLIEDGKAKFDACSAGTEEGRDRILAAANAAGLNEKASCTIGLGIPSKTWPQAAELAINALAEVGGGSVTFSDADISLLVPEGTDRGVFDHVVGELENALPEVFALTAVLPETPDEGEQGPPEFVATLSPEGAVQMRGRVAGALERQTAESYAKARFGSGASRMSARIDETLPASWSVRVLAGLEALAQLKNGAVTITPDTFVVAGDTGLVDANATIAQLLSTKLGEGADFDIKVTYLEKLDPTLGIPTPDECEAGIVEIIGNRKISFEPGASTFDSAAKDILDDIAELLKKCGDIPLEIGGHTDSQGRETMNQQLSQERAQAVLDALRNRRVLTASYRAVGYGEDQPIADNGSADGREANRRIEFKLVRPDVTEEDAESQDGSETETEADAEADAAADQNEETQEDEQN